MSALTLTLQRMTPDAVPPDVPLSRLVAAFQQRATLAVARDQDGAGPVGHALSALALAVALVERVSGSRWGLVELALQGGADAAAAAAATGLTVDELVFGYRAALDARVTAGHLTDAEADALRPLVGELPAEWTAGPA